MDRFLEEIVTKHKRGMDEVLYYLSWVFMIVCALLGFMFLQMLPYVITVVALTLAVRHSRVPKTWGAAYNENEH